MHDDACSSLAEASNWTMNSEEVGSSPKAKHRQWGWTQWTEVFRFRGYGGSASAGERGSALHAHRPVRRQPQGLLSHRHSSAWQLESIGVCVCVCVCERERVCHWVDCCRNGTPHLLLVDLHAALRYRRLGQRRRTSSGMLVSPSIQDGTLHTFGKSQACEILSGLCKALLNKCWPQSAQLLTRLEQSPKLGLEMC